MKVKHIENTCKFIDTLEQDEKNFLIKMAIMGSGFLFEHLCAENKEIFLNILDNSKAVFFHSIAIKCALDNDYERFLDLILQMKEYMEINGMDKY